MSFSINGCKVKIDYSFILVLSFAALFGAENLLCLLLFSALHELSHLSMLIMFRGRPDSLTFSFYGLALRYRSTLSRFKEFAVISAGPIMNLILYLILRDDINLILFALNILPVYPLDGGRLLMLFSFRISNAVSRFFLIVIIFLSIYMIIEYKSFSLMLISIYLTAYSILY